MSRLIGRILLSMMMFPAAGLVCVAFWIFTPLLFGRTPGARRVGWIFNGLLTWTFVAGYWFVLWNGGIKWNSRRIGWTLISAVIGVVAGFAAAFLGSFSRYYQADFLGVITAPLVWLILVTIFWQETPAERSERMRSMNKSGITCPSCGYNLTGLQGTRCPECGVLHTLDELLASQPARADDEMKV